MNQRDDPGPANRAIDAEVIEATLVERPRGPLGKFFLDSTRRLRTIWRFLIFSVLLTFVVIALNVVLGIAVAVYMFMSGGFDPNNGAAALREMERLTTQQMPLLMAIQAATLPAAALALVLLCRKLLDRRSIASMGFTRPQRRLGSSTTVGFLLGMAPIVIGVSLVWSFGGYRLGTSSLSWLSVLLVPSLVLMAFFEEFVFRGYLLQNLIDVRQTAFGVVFTSLLFSLVHAGNPAAMESVWPAINLFGAGLVLSLAYIVSGNIWFPTALHFAWNFAQGVVLNLPISGISTGGLVPLERVESAPNWMTGGEFGLEASVVCTLMEVALMVIFLLALQARKRRSGAAVAQ